MILVSQVYDEAKKIFGICEEAEILQKITDAVEMLANKGDFDPLIGYVDICVDSSTRCITLPREVETIIAINIGNSPALIRDSLFSFHINGPGDECAGSCGVNTVSDLGDVVTFKELCEPSKLVAFVENAEDANKEIWVFGHDENGKWIRTDIDGTIREGYLVPTISGYAIPAADAPFFSRIVRIEKEIFNGPVRLSSFDASATTGTVIGLYEWDETLPIYRRIKLSKAATWVRIAFRRRTFSLKSQRDYIPLHNRLALILAFQSMKFWKEEKPDLATLYEANAARMLTEEQFTRTPPVTSPVQVDPRNNLVDHSDEVN